jgi:hypothetical protein
MLKVGELFGEAKRKPGEPAIKQAHVEVLTFDVVSAGNIGRIKSADA